MYPTQITKQSVTVYKDGRILTAPASHPTFGTILKNIREGFWDGIEKLFDVKATIAQSFKVESRGGELYFGGRKLTGALVERIKEFLNQGFPAEPLVKFLEKALQNDDIGVDSLFKFLETNLLPITPDGNFLAHKSVRSDWLDHHSGTIKNHIGAEPSMRREDVDRNPAQCAGRGLHVGSESYVRGYNGRYIVCEVDPRDVVVVPTSEASHKIRLCKYKVVGELNFDDMTFTSGYAPAERTLAHIKRDKHGRFISNKGPKRDAQGRFVKA